MRDDPTRGFGLLTMKRSEVSQSRQSTSLCLAAKCPTLIKCLSDQSLGGWVGQHVKMGLAQSWSNGSESGLVPLDNVYTLVRVRVKNSYLLLG